MQISYTWGQTSGISWHALSGDEGTGTSEGRTSKCYRNKLPF